MEPLQANLKTYILVRTTRRIEQNCERAISDLQISDPAIYGMIPIMLTKKFDSESMNIMHPYIAKTSTYIRNRMAHISSVG